MTGGGSLRVASICTLKPQLLYVSNRDSPKEPSANDNGLG